MAVGLVLASASYSHAGSGALYADEYLFPGQRLTQNCYYRLEMALSGELSTVDPNGTALWSAGTMSRGGYAVLDRSGNFTIRSWSDQVIWQTGTWTTCSEPVWSNNGGICPVSAAVRQQDDANLVNYFPNGPVWASGVVTPLRGQSCAGVPEVKTRVLRNYDRPGGDFRTVTLSEARPSWCGFYCSQDSQCRAYTYVPPGVQGASAVCWLKSSVPAPVFRNGMWSGEVVGR
jgi:hypothetical protein